MYLPYICLQMWIEMCAILYIIDVPYITSTRHIGYNLGNEWDASHIYTNRNCPLILNQTWIPIIYNGRLSWQTIFTPLLQHMLPVEFQREVATSSIQSYWQKSGKQWKESREHLMLFLFLLKHMIVAINCRFTVANALLSVSKETTSFHLPSLQSTGVSHSKDGF